MVFLSIVRNNEKYGECFRNFFYYRWGYDDSFTQNNLVLHLDFHINLKLF